MEYTEIIEQLQAFRKKQQDNSLLSLGEWREYSKLIYEAYAFVDEKYIHGIPKLITCSAGLLREKVLREEFEYRIAYHGKTEQLRHLCSFLEQSYLDQKYGELKVKDKNSKVIIKFSGPGFVISVDIPEDIKTGISRINFNISAQFTGDIPVIDNLLFSVTNTSLSAHDKIVFARTVKAIQKHFFYHEKSRYFRSVAILAKWNYFA